MKQKRQKRKRKENRIEELVDEGEFLWLKKKGKVGGDRNEWRGDGLG